MSKASLIRRLLDEGETPKEIAKKVGCLDAYVRVVRNRDKHGGKTPADSRWQDSQEYRAKKSQRYKERYRSDADFRARKLRTSEAWRQMNKDRARQHQRNAYARKKAEAHAD